MFKPPSRLINTLTSSPIGSGCNESKVLKGPGAMPVRSAPPSSQEAVFSMGRNAYARATSQYRFQNGKAQPAYILKPLYDASKQTVSTSKKTSIIQLDTFEKVNGWAQLTPQVRVLNGRLLKKDLRSTIEYVTDPFAPDPVGVSTESDYDILDGYELSAERLPGDPVGSNATETIVEVKLPDSGAIVFLASDINSSSLGTSSLLPLLSYKDAYGNRIWNDDGYIKIYMPSLNLPVWWNGSRLLLVNDTSLFSINEKFTIKETITKEIVTKQTASNKIKQTGKPIQSSASYSASSHIEAKKRNAIGRGSRVNGRNDEYAFMKGDRNVVNSSLARVRNIGAAVGKKRGFFATTKKC